MVLLCRALAPVKRTIRRPRSHVNGSCLRYQSSLSSIAAMDVKIVEVGPRDGLQNERQCPSTEQKMELVKKLYHAGCSFIEAGSFVSPKWVPSMADSVAVMQGLNAWRSSTTLDHPLVLSCLVPNQKGLELAVECQADEIAVFASASEGFSQKNINCSIAESIERFRSFLDPLPSMPVRGYVSCVIACPYDGPVAPSSVVDVVEQLLELGCHEISLGDTIGVGTPASTTAMLEAVQTAVGDDSKLAVHFHDTYGQALANILVSLERDITTIDSSVAGLGGCPYAKGATGNVATEDVVYMLDGLGVKTGIDIERLVDAGEYVSGLLGRPSRSRAGMAIASKRAG